MTFESVKEKEESNEWSQDSTDDQLLHELAKAKIHSDGDRDINNKDGDEQKLITTALTTGNQVNDILNETKHYDLETGNQISTASNPQQSTKSKSGKNEEKKIFVGGISWDTTEEDLKNFFSQFGEVSNVQIKYDHFTGRSRGFAFVEFSMPEACQKSLQSKEYDLKNKKIEIKPAKSRENKKIFVGGLPADFVEEELRKHFDQFGKIEEIEWPFDKFQNRRKNFAFIVFEDEDSTQKAAAQPKQKFGDRTVSIGSGFLLDIAPLACLH
uniref:RRM domain-containing protein n=1 Tax=Romanomermis culicivorax TaxID=13658 RepID=A0A915JRV6_ROMCU